MMMSQSEYCHAGWFVPGHLKPGWMEQFRANFNDVRVKFQQLGITPLVRGVGGEEDLGFFFSQAQYNFVQFLTAQDPFMQSAREWVRPSTQRIVAYSLWMSLQGWAGFSPVPVFRHLSDADAVQDFIYPEQDPEFRHTPFGWYLLGRLDSAWYADIHQSLMRAADKRDSLGLAAITPMYRAQGGDFDCVQAVQSLRPDPSGLPDPSAAMAYAEWFSRQGYGRLRATPLLSTTLVEAGMFSALRNP